MVRPSSGLLWKYHRPVFYGNTFFPSFWEDPLLFFFSWRPVGEDHFLVFLKILSPGLLEKALFWSSPKKNPLLGLLWENQILVFHSKSLGFSFRRRPSGFLWECQQVLFEKTFLSSMTRTSFGLLWEDLLLVFCGKTFDFYEKKCSTLLWSYLFWFPMKFFLWRDLLVFYGKTFGSPLREEPLVFG